MNKMNTNSDKMNEDTNERITCTNKTKTLVNKSSNLMEDFFQLNLQFLPAINKKKHIQAQDIRLSSDLFPRLLLSYDRMLR